MTEQSPAEILAELNDLEPDDPDPPWLSQYEVQDIPTEPFDVKEVENPPSADPSPEPGPTADDQEETTE